MTTPVGMVGLLVLVSAEVVAGGLSGPNNRSFEDLLGFVTELENRVYAANSDLSDIATLSAAADERFNLINDRRVPSITLRNAQQSDLIGQFEDQTSALRYRADKARAQLAQAVTTADDTEAVLRAQRRKLYAQSKTNDKQADDISTLNTAITDLEQELVDKIADSRDFLTTRKDVTEKKIALVRDFVDQRKCEYGTASVRPGNTFVPFLTKFKEAPDVAMVINGFLAHLDKYSYKKYDRLALNKKVKQITTDGFYVSAEDLSEGMVEVDVFFCSYMACQFLDKDVAFRTPRPSGVKG